jgi:hypothetical protein
MSASPEQFGAQVMQKSPTSRSEITFLKQPTYSDQEIAILREHIGLALRIGSIEEDITNLKNFFSVHSVSINTLSNDKWEFRKPPLYVAIEQRGVSEFVACLYDIDIYGYGDTIPEAIDDLKEAIINQYEFLLEQESSVNLGIMPKKQLNFLKEIMVEKNA